MTSGFPAGVLERTAVKESSDFSGDSAESVPVEVEEAIVVEELGDIEEIDEAIIVEDLNDAIDDDTYVPLLPVNSGPSADSVTEPAKVIVPLVPSSVDEEESLE